MCLKPTSFQHVWDCNCPFSSRWVLTQGDCVACSWGRIAFHIWRKQMLRFFWSSRCVSALSLFPFPPRRSLTPPHIFFFFFFFVRVCLFRRESVTLCVWCLDYLKFEESWNPFSTMGDIEAPDSTRPRQTVLLSVLPSKEFATSRKGMLLIAEVVRNDLRDRLRNRWDRYCTIVSRDAYKSQRRAFAFWRRRVF